MKTSYYRRPQAKNSKVCAGIAKRFSHLLPTKDRTPEAPAPIDMRTRQCENNRAQRPARKGGQSPQTRREWNHMNFTSAAEQELVIVSEDVENILLLKSDAFGSPHRPSSCMIPETAQLLKHVCHEQENKRHQVWRQGTSRPENAYSSTHDRHSAGISSTCCVHPQGKEWTSASNMVYESADNEVPRSKTSCHCESHKTKDDLSGQVDGAPQTTGDSDNDDCPNWLESESDRQAGSLKEASQTTSSSDEDSDNEDFLMRYLGLLNRRKAQASGCPATAAPRDFLTSRLPNGPMPTTQHEPSRTQPTTFDNTMTGGKRNCAGMPEQPCVFSKAGGKATPKAGQTHCGICNPTALQASLSSKGGQAQLKQRLMKMPPSSRRRALLLIPHGNAELDALRTMAGDEASPAPSRKSHLAQKKSWPRRLRKGPASKAQAKATSKRAQPDTDDEAVQAGQIASALVMEKVWSDKILDEDKTWEIRGEPCWKREKICIAQSKSGTIVGEATIVDCLKVGLQPERGTFKPWLHKRNYIWSPTNVAKHHIKKTSTVKDPKIYAWVLQDAKRYAKPVPYKHKIGHRWVKLSAAERRAVQEQGGSTLEGAPAELATEELKEEPESPSQGRPASKASRARSEPGRDPTDFFLKEEEEIASEEGDEADSAEPGEDLEEETMFDDDLPLEDVARFGLGDLLF